MGLIQWRAYVGPRWRPDTGSPSYAFDYTILTTGAAFDFTEAAGTLSATIGPSATQAFINTMDDWPNVGGMWIEPNGTGEGIEYIAYSGVISTQAQNLQRETDPEHNGTHTAGADCFQWWPLVEHTNAEFTLDMSLDDSLTAQTWQATLSGITAPAEALRPEHMIAIETRQNTGGAWTVYALGWITSAQLIRDGSRLDRWTVTISSLDAMLSKQKIAPQRVGELDIARSSSASASSTLERAYKEYHAGDFYEATPDTSAGSMIDGESGTLWIAEQLVGNPQILGSAGSWSVSNSDPYRYAGGGGALITGIYLRRPAGYDSTGYRWIELTAMGSVRDMYLLSHTDTIWATLDIGDQDYEIGQKIMIVENQTIYERENPISAYANIVEIPDAAGFWDLIDPYRCMLALLPVNSPLYWSHAVAWGNILDTHTQIGAPAAIASDPDFISLGALQWTHDEVADAGIETGEVLAYDARGSGAGTDTDPDDYWRLTKDYAPGYQIGIYDDDEDDPNGGALAEVWIRLDIPPIGLAIRDTITALDPAATDTLVLVDNAGSETNAGLDDSGKIQIGSEIIEYSAKDGETGIVISARGTDGTAATAHTAGDAIQIIDADAVNTDAHAIKSVTLTRPAGGDKITDFNIYTSKDPNARTPETAGWTNDYVTPVQIASNASVSYTHNFSSSRRARVMLITILYMETNPSRPRVNTWKVLLDPEKYADQDWEEDPTDASQIAKSLLLAGGAIADAMNITAHVDVDEANTGEADAWSAAIRFAEYAGLEIHIGRGQRITIRPNRYLVGSLSNTDTWTETNARRFEQVKTTQGAGVSQVQLTWHDGDGNEATAYYPAEPAGSGAVMEIGPKIYANGTIAQAAAERLYNLNRTPYRAVIQPADHDAATNTGEMHRVTWSPSTGSGNDTDRYYLITGVSIGFTDAHMIDTAFEAIQIDREGYQ